MACLLFATGCAGWGGASTAPDLAQAEPGAERRMAGDPGDLPDALDAAFRDIEWARVRLREDDGRTTVVALVPDGREAHITATTDAGAEDRLRVEVRVGRFGAPALQQRLLDALERHLHDRAD